MVLCFCPLDKLHIIIYFREKAVLYPPIPVYKQEEKGREKKNALKINVALVMLMEGFIRGTNLCFLQSQSIDFQRHHVHIAETQMVT